MVMDNLQTMCLEILYKAYQNAEEQADEFAIISTEDRFSDLWWEEYDILQNLQLSGIFEQDGDTVILDNTNSSVDLVKLDSLMRKYGI